MKPGLKRNSGTVIILAMVIIAAVLAASAIFGNLIVSEIRQSRLVDQSIQAFYLAESGAERALHQSRKREAVADCNLVGASSCASNGFCSGSPSGVPCISDSEGSLPGDWNITVSNEREISFNLAQGNSFQIDLFNPYQGNTSASGLQAISIESEDLPVFTLYGQLTNLTWLVGGSGVCQTTPEQPAILQDYFTGSSNVAIISSFSGTTLNPSCSYIFRITNPLNPSIGADGRFTISLYNDQPATPENQMDIPSRLIIESAASFGDSSQRVRVRTPLRPPLSGLYDFVLFSEQEIVK